VGTAHPRQEEDDARFAQRRERPWFQKAKALIKKLA
jgi:hypothetical protein